MRTFFRNWHWATSAIWIVSAFIILVDAGWNLIKFFAGAQTHASPFIEPISWFMLVMYLGYSLIGDSLGYLKDKHKKLLMICMLFCIVSLLVCNFGSFKPLYTPLNLAGMFWIYIVSDAKIDEKTRYYSD